jgi:beta-galactosidase
LKFHRRAVLLKNHPLRGLVVFVSAAIIREMTKIGSVAQLLIGVILLAGSAFCADLPRERLLMDFRWKFHLGDQWGLDDHFAKAGQSEGPAALKFNDAAWRTVDLPHDWAAELPFDETANYDHGYKPLGPGFSTNSIGWYRREFTLPKEDEGKRLWLEFDGVYRDCRVFVNGFRVAHHESGYNSFRCDISDVANYGGKNVVAVRVDASEFEGWFYEGAGIYRHVWLVKTAPVVIAPDGIFVYSQFPNNVPGKNVEIHMETRLTNAQTNSAKATVAQEIIAPGGKSIGKLETETAVGGISSAESKSILTFSDPVLWSPESPELYKLITTVESGGQIVDRKETEFGIRTMAFDANEGFLLNGKHYVIKGTCNHQDHAGVGIGIPDALQNFRVARLKEMGCNAIRTSHNEPAEELVEACDHLGMLVMDENRLLGSDEQNLANLEQHIRRDRNHPSVFIWSLCNEEWHQQDESGAHIFETMQNLVHKLDPTRLCTAAMNGWSGGAPDGFSTVMDVQGFNYLHQGSMDDFHKNNPSKPAIGTEEASAYYTRGIYENTETYKSAYDDNEPGYGATAEEWWKFYSARPWASGSFVWTGFDYRGEASPFHWPNISSEFGILDTCGFPKDIFYYYQSWWTGKPTLHLMPHWNWPGKEGKEINVWAFSNCEEVELFLNGQSLGKKTMPRNSHLQWNVSYVPGTLSAKGYNGGKVVADAKIETTGAPARIQLTPDRATIQADGEDCSVVTVAVTDAQGRVVPVADNLIHFEVEGAGKIIGVGNGNPICHQPDIYFEERPVRTVALDGWRMLKVREAIKNRPEIAMNFDDREWKSADVRADSGPLSQAESAVYRTHVLLTAKDLAARRISVNFGMIDDDGWVYVNGRLAGQSHDWEIDPSFEIEQFLQPGENTVAVVVENGDGSGGLNKGVTLEFEEKPAGIEWRRSVFNGLAQVIVRSAEKSGDIQLRAHADGLADDTIVIHAEGSISRLTVP